jgi:acetoin utilization deacetylase AcuC-like enzyme
VTIPLLCVDDVAFDEHHARAPHPECPERLHAARRAIAELPETVTLAPVNARAATSDELARVHTSAYTERLGRSAGKWAQWDADTFAAPRSAEVAIKAAGGGVALVDALLHGEARFGAALLRPPGHHARPDGAMGFCLLNNVAIAAAHARANGARRVLVVDFDVHHGNGTQEMFYADPNVLFVSTHQFPFYPGTGDVSELGSGDGRGFTANVPLSRGAGNAEYFAAFERVVAPLASEFAPDIVLFSAGFDAHRDDPLAGMRLSASAYSRLIGLVRESVAGTTPMALFLEGGYDLGGLEASVGAAILGLVGASDGPPAAESESQQPLSTLHEREIERARQALREYWPVL